MVFCTLPLLGKGPRFKPGFRTGYTPLSKVEKNMLMHGSTRTDLETAYKKDRNCLHERRNTRGQYTYLARRIARQRRFAKCFDILIIVSAFLACLLTIFSIIGPAVRTQLAFAISMTPVVLKQAIQTRQIIVRVILDPHVLPIVSKYPSPSRTPEVILPQEPFQIIQHSRATTRSLGLISFFRPRRNYVSGGGFPILPGPRPGSVPLPQEKNTKSRWLSQQFDFKRAYVEMIELLSQDENIQSDEDTAAKTRQTAGWRAAPLPAPSPRLKSKVQSSPSASAPPLLMDLV